MKMQTGRLANPKKRRKPASPSKPAPRKRRRRRNPVEPMRAATTARPRRVTKKHKTSRRRERFTGQVTLRRVNPRRSNPSVMGVDLQQTAMMLLSGGVAAFGGSIAGKFIGEKMPGVEKKWLRAATKGGVAAVAIVLGLQMAQKEKSGQFSVLPLAVGFSSTLFASAISDLFEREPMHSGVQALTSGAGAEAEDAAGYDDDDLGLLDDDDDLGTIDEDDDDDELDADLDQIAARPMNGLFPKAEFKMNGSQASADVTNSMQALFRMRGMVQPQPPARTLPRANWMQGTPSI
jgi:hypothetical protein